MEPMDVQLALQQLLSGQPLPTVADTLAAALLADRDLAVAFDLTPATVPQVVQTQADLLRSLAPRLQAFSQTQMSRSDFIALLPTIWQVWLPLGRWLAAQRQEMSRPLVQGILGGQGTGKTTLTRALTLILAELGYHSLSVSLDDLYKTYAERQQLQAADPRLLWRGPPGTHDVALGLRLLDRLRQGGPEPIEIPRFDKSACGGAGDRGAPEIVSAIDIVLFEGWFVGLRPIAPQAFEAAPPPIVTVCDRTFARDMNTQLHTYLPLWHRLDRLWVLCPVDYRLSLQWRQQAEHQQIAAGHSGMSEAEITAFVHYFWKALHPELYLPPLLQDPDGVDLVMEIQSNHQPGRIQRRRGFSPV